MGLGYRIEYEQTNRKLHDIEKKKFRLPIMAVCGVVLVGMLLIPKGREVLWDWILPGDSAVTTAALEGLAENLRVGNSFDDAVMVFCQEIIAGGT